MDARQNTNALANAYHIIYAIYASRHTYTVQSKGNVALARNSILVPRQLYPPYSSLDVHNASKGRVLNHSKTESLDRVLAVPLLARVIPCGSCGHLNTRVGPAGGLPIDKDVLVFLMFDPSVSTVASEFSDQLYETACI